MIPKPAARITWRARHICTGARRPFPLLIQNHRICTHGCALFPPRNRRGSLVNPVSLDSCHLWLPICRPTYLLFASSRRGVVRGLGVAFFRDLDPLFRSRLEPLGRVFSTNSPSLAELR